MNTEINCIRAVAVSLLPVTPYTTFRINFSSGRKGRFIDGNWVLLSRLSRRRDPLFLRARGLLARNIEVPVQSWL